jgi:nucleotide-binding universal stress UspA family protein
MAAKPIVAATDGSEESLRAVDWAAREAVLRGAPLRIVSAAGLLPRMVRSQGHSDYQTVSDVIRSDSDIALTTAAARAAKVAPDLLIDTDHLAGAPAEAVTESGSGALMLVVGSRGVGAFTAMVLGSVSRYAATHASSPVVVVRDEVTASPRQVGIGIGGPEGNTAALTFAFEEAALRKATLIAIHAWHTPQSEVSRAGSESPPAGKDFLQTEATRNLGNLLDEWRGKYPDVPVSQDVVHGHPGRTLAGLSARTDLLVLGRHAVHHGPGGVTHAVLNHAHGTIVTVPAS